MHKQLVSGEIEAEVYLLLYYSNWHAGYSLLSDRGATEAVSDHWVFTVSGYVLEMTPAPILTHMFPTTSGTVQWTNLETCAPPLSTSSVGQPGIHSVPPVSGK